MAAADSLPKTALPTDETLDVSEVYAEQADFVWGSLYRLGGRVHDLADLLQEVFLVVHRRQDMFDGRAIRPWLWAICVGVVRNYHRSRRRRPESLFAEVPEPGARSSHASPEAVVHARQTQERLWQALKRLDPERRAVFWMFEVDGFSCADIAAQTGVPIGTVHSRLHAARKALREATGGPDE